MQFVPRARPKPAAPAEPDRAHGNGVVRLYKLLSVLLEYPTAELIEHLGEIEGTIPALEQATGEDREALRTFLAWARGLPLTERP